MPAWARPSTTAPAATPSTARYRRRRRRGRDSTREAPEGGARLTRSRASGLADAWLLGCQDRARLPPADVLTITWGCPRETAATAFIWHRPCLTPAGQSAWE